VATRINKKVAMMSIQQAATKSIEKEAMRRRTKKMTMTNTKN
jgi:hypothetical protein